MSNSFIDLPAPPANAETTIVLSQSDYHPNGIPFDLYRTASNDFLRLPKPPEWVRRIIPYRPSAEGAPDGPTFGRSLWASNDLTVLTLLERFFPDDPQLALAVAVYATDFVKWGTDHWAVALPTVDLVLDDPIQGLRQLRHVGRLILTASADAPSEVHLSYEGDRGLLWPNTPGRSRLSGPVVHMQSPLDALAWERAAAGTVSVVAECGGAAATQHSLGGGFAHRHVRALRPAGQDPAVSDAFVLAQTQWWESDTCGGSVGRIIPLDELVEESEQMRLGRLRTTPDRREGLSRPPADREAARVVIDQPASPFCVCEWSFEAAVENVRGLYGPDEARMEIRIHDLDRHPFSLPHSNPDRPEEIDGTSPDSKEAKEEVSRPH